MEKRSRRRIRDLVTQLASQGLSENEIGCERISIVARSTNAPFTGRIQKSKTYPLHYSHPACNARPVHTGGSQATDPSKPIAPPMSPVAPRSDLALHRGETSLMALVV